jgi:hypothetical protein
MRKALLVGCGSKFGLKLLESLLEQGWAVYSISGSPVESSNSNLKQLVIDWRSVNPTHLEKFIKNISKIDFVFFNQNSSALSNCFNSNTFDTATLWRQTKDWNQTYFVSCILPFYIIHTLDINCSASTKVAWMLSSMIYNHNDILCADYIGNKYQNYVLMKNFSQHHPACFFGINPDNLSETATDNNILNLILKVESNTDLNGKVFHFDFSEDIYFNLFQ